MLFTRHIWSEIIQWFVEGCIHLDDQIRQTIELTLLRVIGNQLRNRCAPSGDNQGFTGFNLPKESGEMGLGLVDGYRFHKYMLG